MLCVTCAGTEYNLYNLPDNRLPGMNNRRQKNGSHSTLCPECLGQGVHLIRDGSCAHCGSTLLHWQRCSTCAGTGRMKAAQVFHRSEVLVR